MVQPAFTAQVENWDYMLHSVLVVSCLNQELKRRTDLSSSSYNKKKHLIRITPLANNISLHPQSQTMSKPFTLPLFPEQQQECHQQQHQQVNTFRWSRASSWQKIVQDVGSRSCLLPSRPLFSTSQLKNTSHTLWMIPSNNTPTFRRDKTCLFALTMNASLPMLPLSPYFVVIFGNPALLDNSLKLLATPIYELLLWLWL